MEGRLYYDYTPSVSPPGYLRQPNGILDGVDSTSSALVTTFATVAETSKFFDIKQTAYVILVYKTKRGCFDKVVPVVNGCAPLPVDFKSFTATRNRSSVLLRWETSSGINNSGFAVERNVNGTWEQIAFVNSQAANGNSDALLTYTYSDMNNAKGITQYRLKQVDFDNKSKYTEIRSVRGLDQIGKVTVYPNPTSNGTVEKMDYTGFVFFGLITVKGEPFVIEYNCRLGDPETEVIIPRINDDLVKLLHDAIKGNLKDKILSISDKSAATVMMVSGGYPGDFEKYKVINGAENISTSLVFHAGTISKEGKILSNGGRVIAVTTLDHDFKKAVEISLKNVEEISFEGKSHRNDIGFDL